MKGKNRTAAIHHSYVSSYNPMTVKHEGRLADICRHFRHAAALILLQGTCLIDPEDKGPRQEIIQCEGFWGVHWGWFVLVSSVKKIMWGYDTAE